MVRRCSGPAYFEWDDSFWRGVAMFLVRPLGHCHNLARCLALEAVRQLDAEQHQGNGM